MKIKTLVLSIASCFMLIQAVSADETKPMQTFKNLRQAMIDDNLGAIMDIADDKFLEEIKKAGGIDDELRNRFLFTKSAYENVSVRQGDPDKAEVFAFFDMHGEEKRMILSMQKNEIGHRKVVSITISANDPTPALNTFLSACLSGSTVRYKNAVTADFLKKYASIPEGLQDKIANKIGNSKISGSTASFRIDREIVSGDITLQKNGVFWKVANISPALAAPTPGQILKKFCSVARTLKLPQPAPEQESSAENEKNAENEKAGKTPEVSPEMLANAEKLAVFFMNEKYLQLAVSQMTPDAIANIAGIGELLPYKMVKNDIIIQARAETEERTGYVICSFARAADKSWKLTTCNSTEYMYVKTENPASVTEKFYTYWKKEDNLNGALALASDKMQNFLKDDSNKGSLNEAYTITVNKETVNLNTATIETTQSDGTKSFSVTTSLILKKGKWLIDLETRNEMPPEEKKEGEENGGEENPAEKSE